MTRVDAFIRMACFDRLGRWHFARTSALPCAWNLRKCRTLPLGWRKQIDCAIASRTNMASFPTAHWILRLIERDEQFYG